MRILHIVCRCSHAKLSRKTRPRTSLSCNWQEAETFYWTMSPFAYMGSPGEDIVPGARRVPVFYAADENAPFSFTYSGMAIATTVARGHFNFHRTRSSCCGMYFHSLSYVSHWSFGYQMHYLISVSLPLLLGRFPPQLSASLSYWRVL